MTRSYAAKSMLPLAVAFCASACGGEEGERPSPLDVAFFAEALGDSTLEVASLLDQRAAPCRPLSGTIHVELDGDSTELVALAPDCADDFVSHYYFADGLADPGGAVTGSFVLRDVVATGRTITQAFSLPDSFTLTTAPEGVPRGELATFVWEPAIAAGEEVTFSLGPGLDASACALSEVTSELVLFNILDESEPADGPWQLEPGLDAATLDTAQLELVGDDASDCTLIVSACRTRVDRDTALPNARVFNSRCQDAAFTLMVE